MAKTYAESPNGQTRGRNGRRPSRLQKKIWQCARLMSKTWLCKKNMRMTKLAAGVKSSDAASTNTVQTTTQKTKSTEDDESRDEPKCGGAKSDN